jgi:transcriptional regulator with XRE-family HTH domain
MVCCIDRLDHSKSSVILLHRAVGTLYHVPDAEATADAVARNTRRLRTAKGWSLDQLAARSGVSKGMLVHLEQARTNPSLGTLCKVAETLGVSLAGLVELHEAPIVQVVPPGETVRLWSGAEGSAGDLLAGSDERDHVELWHWSIAAGDGLGSDAHMDGTRELLHVLEGTLTLEVDGEAHVVPPGGAAIFHADKPHSYRNEHKRTVRFVMVVLTPDEPNANWSIAARHLDD